MKSFIVSDVSNPLNDSILSIVPPVWPKPLPLSFGNLYPSDAKIGPIINVTLSPTPPVECLSTLKPSIKDRSTISPDEIIVLVRLYTSSSVIPLKYTAIKKADIW